MLMIELEAQANGAHRNQSGTLLHPPEGWAVVPPELEAEARRYLPFIDLTVESGKITGIGQGPVPEPAEPPAPEPTQAERLRADVDFLAAVQGVSL